MNKKNTGSLPGSEDTPLQELLDETQDKAERQALTRAWDALGPLAEAPLRTPEPSGELRALFRSASDRPMTDEELGLLAAAGNPMSAPASEGSVLSGHPAGLQDGPGMNAKTCPPPLHGTPTGDPKDYDGSGSLTEKASGSVQEPGPCVSRDPAARNVHVFGPDDGEEALAGFDPRQDRITFNGAASAQDIAVTRDGADTVVCFGRTTIRLLGVLLDREAIWSDRYLP